MSEKHSPLPWRINPNEHRSACIVDGERGLSVAECWHGVGRGDGRPNAEFIVRAVNSHQALVDALKECREWMNDRRELAEIVPAMARAYDALKLAGEKP